MKMPPNSVRFQFSIIVYSDLGRLFGRQKTKDTADERTRTPPITVSFHLPMLGPRAPRIIPTIHATPISDARGS